MQIIRENHQARRLLAIQCLLGLLAFLAWLSGCSGGNDLAFPTEYQAVFLDNGQIFFGKLGDQNSNYLSLHEVYYVQRQVEPDKKITRNLLMRLGNEWHGPDFMKINTRHLVLIEPVAPNSRVARLIQEAKADPAASPAPPATAPQPPVGAPAVAPHTVEKKTNPSRK
ncbi:MAG: hypothetical protein M1438_08160 [Deltaproteobacteria bacterium]|nr:hypothetical protein [Deltaproteobacteria bacterium]